MGATCPSCGSPIDDELARCPRCGQATTRRSLPSTNPLFRKAPAGLPVKLELPSPVPEARYMSGETWTHGVLYLTGPGVYFLSEADGPWTPEKLAALKVEDPSAPAAVGTLSHFLPIIHLKKFEHSRMTSYNVFTKDGRILPLRLATEGWKLIDAYAAKFGIPSA